MKINLQKTAKKAEKLYEEYNPLDNSYGNFTWKIDPKFSFSEDLLKNPLSIFNLEKTNCVWSLLSHSTFILKTISKFLFNELAFLQENFPLNFLSCVRNRTLFF